MTNITINPKLNSLPADVTIFTPEIIDLLWRGVSGQACALLMRWDHNSIHARVAFSDALTEQHAIRVAADDINAGMLAAICAQRAMREFAANLPPAIDVPHVRFNLETSVYELVDHCGVWLCCFDTLTEATAAQHRIAEQRAAIWRD